MFSAFKNTGKSLSIVSHDDLTPHRESIHGTEEAPLIASRSPLWCVQSITNNGQLHDMISNDASPWLSVPSTIIQNLDAFAASRSMLFS